MTDWRTAGFTAPQVQGLDATTQDTLTTLVKQWGSKLPRNIERMLYLDGKSKLKDLKVALPPQLVDSLEVVMGWPEKAVYELSNRIVLERILGPDGEDNPFGLARVLHDNRFDVEFPQAVSSSLTQSTSFVSTTPGDKATGDPDVLIMFHSALWATGIWDRRRRQLSSGLIINGTDSLGHPTALTILLPAETLVCVKGPRGWYVADVVRNPVGRVPMEPLPFRPTLERPFGRSRIDRRTMSLTDRGVRAGARLEVHSELFSAIKLILLGADESTFKDQSGQLVPLWSFYMGRLNTISKDEEGDLPELKEIKAESPEPHIATLRQLTAEFSGHTGVPLGSLGVAMDNPESAQAKTVAREDIVGDAEKQQPIYTAALRRTVENTVMIRDRRDTPPDEILQATFKWRRPDRPTLAASADAGAKQVAAVPELASTVVGLELLGLDPDQIDRVTAELRRKHGTTALQDALALRTAQLQTPQPAPAGQLAELATAGPVTDA